MWQGNVGQRKEFVVTPYMNIPYSSMYGDGYVNLMKDAEGNVYKWATSKKLEVGEQVTLKATIKAHEEYKGVKQTTLTRGSVL